jgi:hypothetical protein
MRAGECTPEGAQALAQALSSLFLPGTAPEHRCQFVSRIFPFRSYSQVRKQGLSLPRRKRQASLTEPSLKPSEEPKGETRHSVFPESGGRIPEHLTFRHGSSCTRLAAENGQGAESRRMPTGSLNCERNLSGPSARIKSILKIIDGLLTLFSRGLPYGRRCFNASGTVRYLDRSVGSTLIYAGTNAHPTKNSVATPPPTSNVTGRLRTRWTRCKVRQSATWMRCEICSDFSLTEKADQR